MMSLRKIFTLLAIMVHAVSAIAAPLALPELGDASQAVLPPQAEQAMGEIF
jgi:photosystem II stability/assembly factor-like uncharacterized protein